MPAPASTRSNERPGSLDSEEARHLRDLDLEQLAEDRPDIDAGKKIARPPGTLGGAGVVAEVWMVEREVHERGHREGAAFMDDLDQRLRIVASGLQALV